MLINLVFWGVFFSYAYDWPALRIASAALALAGVVCHTLQVWTIADAPLFSLPNGHAPDALPEAGARDGGPKTGGDESCPVSLVYTQASCLFGVAAASLAFLLTTGLAGDHFAVEYAYGYIAGAGWFGLYVVGQSAWLIQRLLGDECQTDVPEPQWLRLAFPGQVAGTTLVGFGLGVDMAAVVAVGAAVNLIASVAVIVRVARVRLARPVMVGG